MSRNVAAVIVVFLALVGEACAQEHWQYEVVPYLWTTGLDGKVGVGPAVSDVHADFNDLVNFVNTGASARMFARRPPWGWFAEASYVELGDDISTALGTVRIKSNAVLAEGGLSYDLAPAFHLYAGLRYQESDLAIENPGGSRFSDNQGWVDAIAGFQWTPVLADHWAAWVRADAGGGSSDLVWLAEVGGGYRWGSRWGAYLAYRILDTDYENGSFVYDVRQEGLLFGFGIRF